MSPGHPAAGSPVSIRYRRLPDRERVFRQRLVEDAGEYVVTLLEEAEVDRPVRVNGTVALEPGAPVVWFTYPGRWHDIGRFHLRDGTFTGVYANILTPIRMQGSAWETTDLCLDVWRGADGRVELLDEDEFDEAHRRGWMDARDAERAREEAERLAREAREGRWPPAHVAEWDLERVRARLG